MFVQLVREVQAEKGDGIEVRQFAKTINLSFVPTVGMELWMGHDDDDDVNIFSVERVAYFVKSGRFVCMCSTTYRTVAGIQDAVAALAETATALLAHGWTEEP